MIFVAHGLGGLLAKQIICLVQDRREADPEIPLIIHGILFVGTPHSTASEDIITIIMKMFDSHGQRLDAVIEFSTANEKIAFLRNLQERFQALFQGFHLKVASFYETWPTTGIDEVDID